VSVEVGERDRRADERRLGELRRLPVGRRAAAEELDRDEGADDGHGGEGYQGAASDGYCEASSGTS
jgi:hypothetical protein